MDATFPAGTYADDFADGAPGRPKRRAPAAAAPCRTPAAPAIGDASGYAPRRSPAAIGLIVAAHAAALWALVHFDVVAIGREKPRPLAVTLVALAPPPPPRAVARPATAARVPTPVVAPPPLVAVATPAPPPLVAAPAPPVPVIAPDAAPAPAAAPVPSAAPAGPPPANLMADVLDAPSPRFPAESRRLRESGTVRLRVTVSAEGRVSAIEVARSSGFDRLDEAAAAAVKRWRFRPRTVAGVAAEVTGFVPVTFNPPH